jgi:hypothetical protein
MASVQGQVLPDTGSRLVLRSRLGAITLVLLCAVQFLDIADSAIVNVALPSIQHSLGFSQQNLQWVASGYILTYGGRRSRARPSHRQHPEGSPAGHGQHGTDPRAERPRAS